MPTKLGEVVAAKIRADFPTLSINQIAGKYGVAWQTVKNLVDPMKEGTAAGQKTRLRGKRARAAITVNAAAELLAAGALVDSFWNQLSLTRKIGFLLGTETK